jgi:N-terminal acetyltransferase B complex non-catalytic subunit
MVELNRVRDPKEVEREKQLEEEDKAERERVKAKLATKGGDKEADEETEVVETTLEGRVHEAREVLEKLADTDGQEERGSLLALLELERRLRDESDLKPGELFFLEHEIVVMMQLHPRGRRVCQTASSLSSNIW